MISKAYIAGLALIALGLIGCVFSVFLLIDLGLQADRSPAGGDGYSGWWQAGVSISLLVAGIVVASVARHHKQRGSVRPSDT